MQGGARHYVDKILAGIGDKRLNCPVRRIEHVPATALGAACVRVHTDGGSELFDKVIIATHSDQALQLLADPSAQEQATLGAIRYQQNLAVLHTDSRVLPQRRSAWAAWNYERAVNPAQDGAQVCLHYWLNRLQPLPWTQPVVVSLNPIRPIDDAQVLGRYDYAHPVFDLPAVAAQGRMDALQGPLGRYYAGAWMGYGFHEDGLKAGLAAAAALLNDSSWPGASA